MPRITRSIRCLVLNAPEWYQRKDFANYVVKHSMAAGGQRCPSYHVGDTINEYSDIFVHVGGPGLEDISEDLPADIANVLHEIANEEGDDGQALFWIQNLTDCP